MPSNKVTVLDPEINSNNRETTFTVILKNKKNKSEILPKYSIVNSAKPLIFFTALFAMQIFSISSKRLRVPHFTRKLYGICVVLTLILILVFVNPMSWKYTLSDLPLNILTKAYSVHHTCEVAYAILAVAFDNSGYYIILVKLIDDIDKHLGSTKRLFFKRRLLMLGGLMSIVIEITTAIHLRNFRWQNTIAYVSFFLILLQGVIFSFFLIAIFGELLTLNYILLRKNRETVPSNKVFVDKKCLITRVYEKFQFQDDHDRVSQDKLYSWFELMQIYDKVADSIYIFNKIYTGQVLLMFNGWLICTLLTICRSLSPSIKYNNAILISDVFMYSSINNRPILLAKTCEMFIEQRNTTMSLLLHTLVHGNLSDDYINQIHTMLELVKRRRLEVSANVFTINIPAVLQFAGKVISYTVLMIQYFYMHTSL